MRPSSRKSATKNNWLGEVKQFTAEAGDELELCSLRDGDRLQVKTRHTLYDFTWLKQGETEGLLTTDRIDRPLGKVRVNGCVLGRGTTIAPQRLFTGGSLEFTSEGGAWVHRTSRIVWIRMIRNLRA